MKKNTAITRKTDWGNQTDDFPEPNANQLIALSKALQVSIHALVENDTQELLEQKVQNVESKVVKNNSLLKIVMLLSFLIILLVLVIISAA